MGERHADDRVGKTDVSAKDQEGSTGADGPDAQDTYLPMGPKRKVLARRMVQSLHDTAQLTLMREVEVGAALLPQGGAAPGSDGRRITPTDRMVEIVARTLLRFPRLNARLEDDRIVLCRSVNIGVAVAQEDGLIVPVIHEAQDRTLGDIADIRSDLVAKARAGKLGIDDVSGGTFTISNLGAFGVDAFTPILNPPQAAILGVGRIVSRAVVVDDVVVVRPVVWLSLTIDHRLIDGAPGAEFLAALSDAFASSGETAPVGAPPAGTEGLEEGRVP